jgi:hypothetical protein
VDLALYFNAASYGISALTVYFLREIPKRNASGKISVPSTAKSIWEGWRFIRQATPVVRGLVLGMLGAFAAAGVVVGLGYPTSRHAARRQRRLGPGLRRDLRRDGARHGARHQGARRLQPAAAVRLSPSPPPRCRSR